MVMGIGKIQSKPPSKEYLKNYDRIFRKKIGICEKCGKILEPKHKCEKEKDGKD